MNHQAAEAQTSALPTIVRAVRVELIKPLNYTWDEVGSVLRRQRAVMHRLMNAAVLGCIDAGRKMRTDAPQTAAYREAGVALTSFNDWVAKQPGAQTPIELPGGTLAGVGSIAADAWKRWVKSKGNERIPSFGKGQPIPIRAQESELQRDDRGFALRFNLHAVQGSKREWVRFALAVSSGRHHQALRALCDGHEGWETLALKLDYDERKKKWYALISHRRPIDKAELDPTVMLVVHRGGHNFVGCMSSNGHWSTVSGRKLLAQKRKLKARRRDMQMVGKSERGDGAKGHGTASPRRIWKSTGSERWHRGDETPPHPTAYSNPMSDRLDTLLAGLREEPNTPERAAFMTDTDHEASIREAGYIAGQRATWCAQLEQALRALAGYGFSSDPRVMLAQRVSHEERTRAALREVCRDHGDNDWSDDLHLSDVVEKHLGRYLDARAEDD